MIKRFCFFAACLCLVALILLMPKILRAGNSDNPHKELFESKCTKCHDLKRVGQAHKAKKDLSETIKRMSKKKGSDISQEDLDAIDEYILSQDFDIGSG